ncbi:MAG: hypothetical protein MJE68_12580, partial [Proteobacteria bacterium]|nr:hypothetical protein [Pseudomonadota bacterium]
MHQCHSLYEYEQYQSHDTYIFESINVDLQKDKFNSIVTMNAPAVIVAMHMLACFLGGASAITPPDTSLNTLPVGYFGGVNCKERSQENINMLAKLRVIVIEKWEGPCWYECYANL